MADVSYKYKLKTASHNCVVKYTITPDFSDASVANFADWQKNHPGESIQISGEFYGCEVDIYAMEISFGGLEYNWTKTFKFNNIVEAGTKRVFGLYGVNNKAYTLPSCPCILNVDDTTTPLGFDDFLYENGGTKFPIQFAFQAKDGTWFSTNWHLADQRYIVKRGKADIPAPTLSINSVYDSSSVLESLDGSTKISAYKKFGKLVTGVSKFNLYVGVTTTAQFKIVVNASGGSLTSPIEIYNTTYTGYLRDYLTSAGNITVRIPVQSFYGDITFTIKVIDDFEQTATVTKVYTYAKYTKPKISKFEVVRYKTILTEDVTEIVEADDGESGYLNMTASACSFAGNGSYNAWTTSIDCVAQKPVGEDNIEDLFVLVAYEGDGKTSTGVTVTKDYDTFSGFTFDSTINYTCTATIRDIFGTTVTRTFTLKKATAYFYVGKNGVAVGMRSTATEGSDTKLFEVQQDYDSIFYGDMSVNGAAALSKTLQVAGTTTLSGVLKANGGITGVTNYSASQTKTGGTWLATGSPVYRRIMSKSITAGGEATFSYPNNMTVTQVIRIDGGLWTGTTFFPLSYYAEGGRQLRVYATKTQAVVNSTHAGTVYLIIEYI